MQQHTPDEQHNEGHTIEETDVDEKGLLAPGQAMRGLLGSAPVQFRDVGLGLPLLAM